MTARLRNEARALLPYWAGTLAATAAPHLLGSRGAELSWFSYCFGCALLGGVSFGHEIQHRTFPMLLSQPISRSVIWRDKMLALAAALLTSTAVLAGASAASGSPSLFDAAVGQGFRFLPFIPLCVFCGAPLFTLLTGSVLGAAILSLALPGYCLTLAMAAHLLFPALGEAAITSALLLVCCPLAGAWGYARFQSYETRPPRSPALAIPGWLLPRTSSARGRPLVALLGKELRLQYWTFILVIPLWGLLSLGGFLAAGKRDWAMVASVVAGIDLLVLPLVAGAIALGEERSLGVADWQLSLPPPARLQWFAKMLVTLPSSLVLGLVVPLSVTPPSGGAGALVVLVVGNLLLTHLAIYAGSLSSGTMSAVLLALGFSSAAGLVGISSGLLERLGGIASIVAAMAAMVVVLHAFAFSNYRQGRPRLSRLGLQGLAVGGLLAAFAVLPRVWIAAVRG